MADHMSGGGTSNRINAVHNMFTIVDALRKRGRVGVTDLSRDLEMPRSTVHVYLQTLAEEGYVVNHGGEYELGLRFLELGGDIRKRQSIFQAARPGVDALSAETGEVANLGVEEQGQRVLLYSSEPSDGVFDNSPTGQFTHMHWTALGKALLAQLPDDRVSAIIERYGLPKATENTITDPERLFDELERIREQGHSIEDEERREGIKAIAVMVEYEDDPDPVSAVAISGPKRRIGEDEFDRELLDAIRDTVNVIELKYKHY